jgi:hypothetical protein
MGWTAFGGPAAHIGIFQKNFVEAKKWMSMTVFNELLSLGQCLPAGAYTRPLSSLHCECTELLICFLLSDIAWKQNEL